MKELITYKKSQGLGNDIDSFSRSLFTTAEEGVHDFLDQVFNKKKKE